MDVIAELFLKVFSMGVTASVVIIFVLLVRGSIMRNFPKKYVYVLWLVVGVRLICPITVSSSVSVFNLGYYLQNIPVVQALISDLAVEDDEKLMADNGNKFSEKENILSEADIRPVANEEWLSDVGGASMSNKEDTSSNVRSKQMSDGKITVSNGSRLMSDNGTDASDDSSHSVAVDGNKSLSNGNAEPSEDMGSMSVDGGVPDDIQSVTLEGFFDRFIPRNIINVLAVIWMSGIFGLLIWNLFQYIVVRHKICKAVLYHGNIYECDCISSPFVMGLIFPRIYVPFRLGKREREYIIEHEKYHISRHDYIVNVLSFLITIVYWFNPLVWISYFCMIRDMEMSCDEHVIAVMDMDIRRDYSESLLAFAVNRRRFRMNLPAFGETDTRRRVKNIMNFKKKGKWISIAAVLLVLAIGAICITDANAKRTDEIIKPEKGIEDNNDSGDKNNSINNDSGDKKENADNKTKKNGKETIVAEENVNGLSVQLILKKGKKKQIIEENSPKSSYTSVYEGTFYLRSCKDDKVLDKKAVTFFDGENKLIFPEKIVLTLSDYDGDKNADDFSLGQKNASSLMEYQFYTVDEDGGIVQYGLATDTETTESIVTKSEIWTDGGDIDYSKKFNADSEGIKYVDADNKNGREHEISVSVIRLVYLTGDEGNSDENSAEKKLHKAVDATMPKDIVIEAGTGVWHELKYGKDETGYLLANSDTYKDITMRLDFTFYKDTLIRYVSKDYGFVGKMQEKRIDSKQAAKLVQKFAKEFNGEKIGIADMQSTELPIEYNSKDFAALSDKNGNSYIVQLNRNMVVSFEMGEQSTGFVFDKQTEIDEREKEKERKRNNTVMFRYYEPDTTGGECEYFIPEAAEQEKLQKPASKLDTSYVCREKELKQFHKQKELGYEIEYAGNVWGVYSGGYVRILGGKDFDIDKSERTIMHCPELCKLSGKILKDTLDYAPIDLNEIKDITSATLAYSTGELNHTAQEVTDKESLRTLEKLLSSAKYIAGGSGCPFGDAVLTLRRRGKKEIQVSLATDGCAVFRLNGVYYDYGSSNNATKIRKIFKDVKWEHL